MSENRRQILEMLSQGKITADEAERLLTAVESNSEKSQEGRGAPSTGKVKYLRVMVESEDSDHGNGPTKVNIRVPMQLLRAGVKLAGLLPDQARSKVNEKLKEIGIDADVSQIKPENLDELIDQMNDLQVDVDETKNKVRIFCE